MDDSSLSSRRGYCIQSAWHLLDGFSNRPVVAQRGHLRIYMHSHLLGGLQMSWKNDCAMVCIGLGFFPYAIYFPAERIWETWLSTLLLCVLFGITLKVENSRQIHPWIWFGIVWGMEGLTSPVALAVLPFWAGWIAFRKQRADSMNDALPSECNPFIRTNPHSSGSRVREIYFDFLPNAVILRPLDQDLPFGIAQMLHISREVLQCLVARFLPARVFGEELWSFSGGAISMIPGGGRQRGGYCGVSNSTQEFSAVHGYGHSFGFV